MKCGICRAGRLNVVFLLNENQSLYDCRECGVRQLLPQRVVRGDYRESYYDYYGRGLQSDGALVRLKVLTYSRMLRKLATYVQPGTLLDIGCGLGHAMKVAKELGWRVVGTEFSPDAARLARRYTDSPVYMGDVRSLNTFASFDAITLFDVIEHLPDPKRALAHVSMLLKSHGGVLIVTPDVASLSSRLMGKRWNHYHPDHLFYFDRHSIQQVIPKSLTIRSIMPTVKLFNLAYIHGYFMQYPTIGFTQLARFLYAVLPQSVREFPFAMQSGSMMVIAQKEQ